MKRTCTLAAVLTVLAVPGLAAAQPPDGDDGGASHFSAWQLRVRIAIAIDDANNLRLQEYHYEETAPAKYDPKTGEPLTPAERKIVKSVGSYPLQNATIFTADGKALTVEAARKRLADGPTTIVTVNPNQRPPTKSLQVFKADTLVFAMNIPEPPPADGKDEGGKTRMDYGNWDLDIRFAAGLDNFGDLQVITWIARNAQSRLEFDKDGNPTVTVTPGKITKRVNNQTVAEDRMYDGTGKKVAADEARKKLGETTPVLLLFAGSPAPGLFRVMRPETLVFTVPPNAPPLPDGKFEK
jgi:hypothetical protein